MSSIVSLETLTEQFCRPLDFDLDAYWTSSVADFHAGRHRGEAVIRLSPRGLRRLPNRMPDDVVKAVAATTTRPASGTGSKR